MSVVINPYSSISDSLPTAAIGKRIIYYPRLTSTMDIARQEAQQGAVEGTVIIAGEQTGGRGRERRVWLSPGGNIALSIILHPDISCLPYLVMLASLAVVYSIEVVTGLKPQIKWPNDILIDGKKVCGILIESKVKGSRVAYAVIGIGINVEMKSSDITSLIDTATSLNDESGRGISRVDIVKELLIYFEKRYLELPDGEAIYRAWRDRLVTLGKSVVVASGNNILEGVAESVERSGALVLRLADGTVASIVAGDVMLRQK